MLHGRMLLAFLDTGVAHVGAGLADHARELAATAHIARRQAADRGAVDVELYAAGKHPDVLLVQAGRGAVVASQCAGVAGVDAGLELLMWHRSSESRHRRKKCSRPWNPIAVYASKRYGRIQN